MNAYRGKKAVVIGGTHGMGMAMVNALLAGGAEVLLTGRNGRTVEAARNALSNTAHVVKSDAGNLTEIDSLADEVAKVLGSIDALFVNVGTSELMPFEQVTEAAYDRMFLTNTKGAFFTTQRLAPLINENGAIVFTTVTPSNASPTMSVYLGTKGAVREFTKAIAVELLPRKIRINAVAPGFIDTPTMGVAGLSDEDRVAFMKIGNKATPMQRHGTAEEVARAAMFLAFGATFSTGIELAVDGGLSSVEAPHG